MWELDDFCYMWRGRCVRQASYETVAELAPINLHGAANSRALLLLHGFASSPAVFRQLHPAFMSYDAVVAPLLPGHGTSIAAFASTTATAWVRAAEDHCAALVRDYDRVDVLGLSLGGVLAHHLSHIFPIHHLFLLAPAFKLSLNLNWSLNLAHCLRACGVRTLINRGGNIIGPDHAELTYTRLPINTIIEVLTFISTAHLIAPTCATDLFLGRQDRVVNSQEIAQQCDGLANIAVHWLENSAHVLPLDSDISRIIHIIQSRTVVDPPGI